MNNSDAEQVDHNWNPVDKMQTVRTSQRQNVYWCRPDVVMNQVQPSEILSLGSVADGGRQCVYAAGWRVKHQPVHPPEIISLPPFPSFKSTWWQDKFYFEQRYKRLLD